MPQNPKRFLLVAMWIVAATATLLNAEAARASCTTNADCAAQNFENACVKVTFLCDRDTYPNGDCVPNTLVKIQLGQACPDDGNPYTKDTCMTGGSAQGTVCAHVCDPRTDPTIRVCEAPSAPYTLTCAAASSCCLRTSAGDCPAVANGTNVCSGDGGSCQFACNPGYKKCGNHCIAVGSCCTGGDCAAPANGSSVCPAAGASCQVACNAGFKQCGNACIPNGTCCSASDCPAPAFGQGSATCSAPGGTCAYVCAAGQNACNGGCIPSTSCCSANDCPGDAVNHLRGVCGGAGNCSYACEAGYKACGLGCVPQNSCCTSGDCQAAPNGCFQSAGTCSGPGGTCSYAYNNGAACNADSNRCTPNDACQNGACVADTQNAVKCVRRECHSAPSCNPATGACEDAVMSGSCGGNGCAPAGTCNASGNCSTASQTKDCSALGSVCKVGVCDASNGDCATANKPNELACDSGNKCIVVATCSGGACVGTPKVCAAAGPCERAECDPATGGCVVTKLAVGTSCHSGDACQQYESCNAQGACVGSTAQDGTPCESQTCDSGAAVCGSGSCGCASPGGNRSPDMGSAAPDMAIKATGKPDKKPTADAAEESDSGCAMVGHGRSSAGALWIALALLALAVTGRTPRWSAGKRRGAGGERTLVAEATGMDEMRDKESQNHERNA